MNYKLFEIFITHNGKQINFELSDRPFIFGSDSSCDVVLDETFKNIAAVIKKENNKVIIKTYDENLLININNKKYKSAKFDKPIFLKLGNIDLVFNVEEKVLSKDLDHMTTAALKLDDFKDVSEPTKKIELPNLNENLPEQPVLEAMQKKDLPKKELPKNKPATQPAPKSEQAAVFIDPKEAELEDIFKFNITFDDSTYNELAIRPYENEYLDFSDYIDTKDETVKELPVPDVHKTSKTKSVHVSYMNNGVVLNDRYFEDTRIKRVFLSKSYNKKNYIQAFDIDKDKKEFIFYRNKKISILVPEGFKAQKGFGTDIFDIDTATLELNEGERIILSRGTTQIIVQFTVTPPSLKSNRFFNVDDLMLKSMASAWAFALAILAIVVAFPPIQQKVEEEQKVVVIYKKKDVAKPENQPKENTVEVPKEKIEVAPVEDVVVEAAPAEAEKIESKGKKKEKVVKNEKIPDVKIKKVKKKVNKVAKAIKKKRHVNKLAKKKAPSKAPEKKFKFNFGSKMKTMISSTSKTKLKDAKNIKNINLASSVKSTTKITSEFDQKKIGATKNKVSRFMASNPSKSKVMIGTKGLSGKTKTSTAYIEESTKILGALDPEVVRVILREYIPQFRHCYQRELITNPSVAGIFDIQFQINGKGSGINVGVLSKGKGFSKTGKNCLKRVVSLIKFPKPKGGGVVDVKQPMNFYKQ